jgi:hypothetical protein
MILGRGHGARFLSLVLLTAGMAACAACGEADGEPGGPGQGAGGAGATTTTSGASSGTTTASTTSGGGGEDGREWTNLDWPGLPCPLLVAGPTEKPTLSWKACAVPGCSFIDPSPFTLGSNAVGATHQNGTVLTALVQRAGGFDSVVWDAITGQERFAIRGHPDCMPKDAFPFVFEGAERGWFGVRTSGGGFADHAYYEVDLSDFSATKLAIPDSMSSQRMAGDVDHLALEKSGGPNVGIWSRATGTFTYLSEMVSFDPRSGAGGVYFLGPDAGADLDVFWWQNGTVAAAVTASPGIFAVNPWVVGTDLVWTEAPAYDQPGVVKRAPLQPSSFPLTGEVVVPLDYAGSGQASERFYVSATKVDNFSVYRLQVVHLQAKTVAIIDLPPEVKWPSTVDFVGKDPFGEKEVAWVQANDTVYRIEIE